MQDISDSAPESIRGHVSVTAYPCPSHGFVGDYDAGTQAALAYDGLDSDLERRLYGMIRQVVVRRLPSLPLLTSPEIMNSLMCAVLDDNPQLFWFEGRWAIAENEGKPVALLRYACDSGTSRRRSEELGRVVEAVVGQMDVRDPYLVALWLYDWMVGHVKYGSSGSLGQTSYDALVRREALCKGIAKGYQLLLARFGVPSTLVRGAIRGAGRHVWNLVRVRDSLLHVDVTLAHGRFNYLFPEGEWNNPRRCFLMGEDFVRGRGITIEEG